VDIFLVKLCHCAAVAFNKIRSSTSSKVTAICRNLFTGCEGAPPEKQRSRRSRYLMHCISPASHWYRVSACEPPFESGDKCSDATFFHRKLFTWYAQKDPLPRRCWGLRPLRVTLELRLKLFSSLPDLKEVTGLFQKRAAPLKSFLSHERGAFCSKDDYSSIDRGKLKIIRRMGFVFKMWIDKVACYLFEKYMLFSFSIWAKAVDTMIINAAISLCHEVCCALIIIEICLQIFSLKLQAKMITTYMDRQFIYSILKFSLQWYMN